MIFRAAKTSSAVLCVALIACAFSRAQCSVNSVVVKGRIEHAPANPSVRVQLLYANDQKGESAEASLDRSTFSIPVEYLTQSNHPVLLSGIRTRCARKPQIVVVTLKQGDQEFDRVSLDFAKDFKTDDSSVYTLRSELVLNGQKP
jgi:hypothetical protein